MPIPPDDKFPSPRNDGGWWEYGTQLKQASGRTLQPTWNISKLDAEIAAERFGGKVVRRWITPGPWEDVEPNDHMGVADWEWQQYLDWRAKRLEQIAAEARAERTEKRLELP